MAESAKVRPDVLAFADAMEAKLAEKDATHGPRGWANDAPRTLLRPLIEHVDKLAWLVVEEDADPKKIRRAAADVGNFAMMIHAQAERKATADA